MRIDYKTWGLIILGLLVGALFVLRDPTGQWPTREGLDIAGGVRVVMELEPSPGVTLNQDTQRQVIDVLERRVNTLGVSEPVIQPKGVNQVIVELAESQKDKGQPLDKRSAVQTLQKTAQLEFIYLKDVKSEKNPLGRYDYNGSSFRDLQTNKTLTDKEVQEQILYRDDNKDGKPDNVIVTGKNIKPGSAQANFSDGSVGTVVTLAFDNQGRDAIADFTRNHVKDLMAIVYDKKVQSAPIINEEINTGDMQITLGDAPLSEAVEMKDLLNSGALPVPLKVVQIQEVEASLGRDSVNATRTAGLVGLGAVCLFMILYYLLPGAVAVVALIFYALFTFALFKLLGVVLTLPGIAGFILSIGMAVDANILIFERLKEELRSGRTLHAAIDAGFSRAFPSIRDANIATLITCAILWMYGTGGIRGFALVLGLGVMVSFFTAMIVTRALLHLIVNDNIASKPSLFGVTRSWLQSQGRNRIDVIKNRVLFFGISVVLIVPGLIFLLIGGLKPGIDFTGGTMVHYNFPQSVQSQDIRSTLQGAKIEDVQIQLSQGTAGGMDAFVRTRELTDVQRDSALKALQAKYPKVRQVAYDRVGSTISRELVRNAFLTILLASALITIFLAYQFKSAGFKTGLKYGLAALIALVHDVLAVLGLFAITGYFLNWEVDSLFITAMLTVIGFSVHDTIIVFDRVRENWRNRSKEATFEEVVNASVNQTLSRSINTNLTVIITLCALFFFGGSVLKLFIAALLYGITLGTYSSIFNASPLLWLMDRIFGADKTGPTATPVVRRAATVAPTNRPSSTPSRPATPVATEGEGSEGASFPGMTPRPTARPTADRAKAKVSTKRKKRF